MGSSLTPLLRRRGHAVMTPGRRDVDLTHEVVLADEHRDLDVVIHAAALYGGMPFDMANQAGVLATNTLMNLRVFEFCRRAKPRTLITIGSACAYPGFAPGDLHEEDFQTGPPHPSVACHAFSKLWMIEAHRAYKASHGLNGVHIVPANLYGPNDVYRLERAHVVAALIKKYTDAHESGSDVELLGDGSPVRELLYIDDLSEIITRAAERLTHEDLPINAGTGIGHTIGELSALVADKVGFRGRTVWGRPEDNGTARKVMDTSRMQKLLGPFHHVPLEDGIERTLTWYRPRKREADKRA